MKTVLIACKTLKTEIELVIKNANHRIDELIWIESGLHNVSKDLQDKLQEEFDHLYGVKRVLLAFGFCGNALAGLKTRDFELVFPRVDDCISLLLGSHKRKKLIQQEAETYFLTKGWLQWDKNIYNEYLFIVEKYGKETADSLYDDILGSYKDLGIIDTGVYDFYLLLEETKVIADALKLRQKLLDGTLTYLEKLFSGIWNTDEFVIIPEYSEITLDLLKL